MEHGRCCSTIKMHKDTKSIKIKQEDTTSPKLFTLTLKSVFIKMDYNDRRIVICGRRLNNFRYADDVVLVTDSTENLKQMLEDLAQNTVKIAFEINDQKRIIMAI